MLEPRTLNPRLQPCAFAPAAPCCRTERELAPLKTPAPAYWRAQSSSCAGSGALLAAGRAKRAFASVGDGRRPNELTIHARAAPHRRLCDRVDRRDDRRWWPADGG